MYGSTAREQRMSASTFTSKSCCQSSSLSVAKFPGCARPALLTSPSMPPSFSAERSTKSCTCAGSVTSATWACVAPIASPVALYLLLAPRADRDACALLDELARDRLAEALRAAGDEHAAAFEIELHRPRR